MKRFIKELLIALIITSIFSSIAVFLFYRYAPEQYDTNYVAAMWDKYIRLVSIDEPKIVLIGDSNLAFGLDSARIQEDVGMPVVNMGLHGGLGNDVQTEIAMSNVNKGDIYVIVYSDYSQDKDISQKDLTLIMLGHHRDLWDRLTIKQKVELVPAIPDYMFNSMSFYIRGRGNEEIEEQYSDYSRKGFNEYGDNTVRIAENANVDYTEYESVVSGISNETIELIERWRDYCKDRGATVVIASYPIVHTDNMDNPEVFRQFYSSLENKTGCKVISDPEDYIMDSQIFYDTELHLTIEGAEFRTKLLLNDIRRYIDER